MAYDKAAIRSRQALAVCLKNGFRRSCCLESPSLLTYLVGLDSTSARMMLCFCECTAQGDTIVITFFICFAEKHDSGKSSSGARHVTSAAGQACYTVKSRRAIAAQEKKVTTHKNMHSPQPHLLINESERILQEPRFRASAPGPAGFSLASTRLQVQPVTSARSSRSFQSHRTAQCSQVKPGTGHYGY